MSRQVVRSLAPYVPGTSIEEVRERYGLDRIIKLASNENPLGSSPRAIAALAHVGDLHLYSNDGQPELKAKIAARHGVSAQNLIFGHGSNELVNLIAETLLDVGDEAVMAAPSFLLYPLVTRLQGGTAIEVLLRDGVHDLGAMLAAVTPKTKLMFVCDPNNPTGTALSPSAWSAFLVGLPSHVTLVIDQAYREYMGAGCADAVPFITQRPNTIVLRTMSKAYGLASLRFGYAFADTETIGWLERVRLPFNVSAPAAIGAMAALDDDAFVARSVANNEAGKTFLMEAFARLGLHAYPSEANFLAVTVPAPATRAYNDLLERGIIVRSGDALGMPGRLRVTIGTPDENRALVALLEELLPVWRSA